MKHPLLTTFIAFAVTAISHASNSAETDTIKVIKSPSKVVVTTQGNTTIVSVTGVPDNEDYYYQYATDVIVADSVPSDDDDWNPEHIFLQNPDCAADDAEFLFPFTKPRRHRVARFDYVFIRNIYWGWMFRFDADPAMKNSFECGIGEMAGVSYTPWLRGPELSLGLGIRFSQYCAQDGYRYMKQGENLLLVPLAEGERADKSRVMTATFCVPLMITQRIYRKLYVSAGANANFNTYTRAFSQYYTDDNTRMSSNYKGLHQRLLTVDYTAIVGFNRDLGFYFRYSPMSVMRHPYGPEAKSFSIGLTLNF